MAIYHFSAQVASRSAGRSAVAMAAYRSGERLNDERTGEMKFYRRDVKPENQIMAPLNSPQWIYNRDRLWNEVEKSEKRKDAQLCREINVALPKELSKEQQKKVLDDFCQREFVDRGMVADVSIHRDDPSNPHAHIMLTTREIQPEGFGQKCREWNDRELLSNWREEWANTVNQEFERLGFPERIDHRSHEERELETLPTIHEGHVARQIEKQGRSSERVNVNREVKQYNSQVIDLQKAREERSEREKWKYFNPEERTSIKDAAKICRGYVTEDKLQDKLDSLKDWDRKIEKSEGYFNWKDVQFSKALQHYNSIIQCEQSLKNSSVVKRMFSPFERDHHKRVKREITYHKKQLDRYKKPLGFTGPNDFNQKRDEFYAYSQAQQEKNSRNRRIIYEQRRTLTQAQEALKNAQAREKFEKLPDVEKARIMKEREELKPQVINFNDKEIREYQKQYREAVEKEMKKNWGGYER